MSKMEDIVGGGCLIILLVFVFFIGACVGTRHAIKSGWVYEETEKENMK